MICLQSLVNKWRVLYFQLFIIKSIIGITLALYFVVFHYIIVK